MPMIFPPIYLDVPAIIQPAAQSSGAHAPFKMASPPIHPGLPSARPQDFTSGPDLVSPPKPGAQPQGLTEGPNLVPPPNPPGAQPQGFTEGPDLVSPPNPPGAQPQAGSSLLNLSPRGGVSPRPPAAE